MYQHNYNPYRNVYNNPNFQYNRSSYTQNPYMRGNIPLSIPRGNFTRSPISSFGVTSSKATLSKILTGTENFISTINQVIPIYQQVKPLFANSKILKGVATKIFPFFSASRSSTREETEIIEDVEVINPNSKTKTQTSTNKEQFEPNKPFFG